VKALVHTAPLRLEYVDRPAPVLAPDEVLVRVVAVAICGSDVHGYTGSTGRRIPPIVMGHEAAGVVEAVGRQVPGWQRGTRVTFDSTVYCNECPECRRGRINLCERRQILGVSTPAFRRDGAMAEFVAVPHWILHPVPEGLALEEAALVEPAAVAMHAARITPIEPGGAVVIVGAGAIGLFAMQAARLRGAGTVVVVDVRDERLALASQLGADVVVNSESSDPREALRTATGRPVSCVVMEAVGIQQTVALATELTAPGGHLTLIGNVQPSIEQNLQAIVAKEMTIRGSAASAGEYATCLAFLAGGRLQSRPLISRVMPLAEGQAAFDALRRGEPGLLKIVLRPEPGAATPPEVADV
jgi:L-iditol 2-dehydrogenase